MSKGAATGEPASTSSSVEHEPGTRHLGLALVLISAAQLMIVLDGTVVNIALPHIQTSLGFSQQNLQWVVTGYTLTFGGLLLLGGRSGDLLGRRRMFMVGVLIFALASCLGGLAQSEVWLILSRLLQGVGAAIASPTALSLITTTFPAGPKRNRAIAVYGAMSGAGAAIGLILGGALTQIHTADHDFGWRLTLLINVPIGLFVVFLAPRVLAESETRRGMSLDLPGALAATGGLASLVYGLTHAAGSPAGSNWDETSTWFWLILGVVLIAAFLVIEARSTEPLMPPRVVRNRSRGVSYLAMLIVGAAMFAMFFFISLFVQQVLGYSPIKAGLAFLPFTVGIAASSQAASALLSRIDPRYVTTLGAFLGAAGMLWFSRLTVDSGYWAGLLPGILALSVGLGMLFIPLTLTATHGVRSDAGIASAVLNTSQQIGGAVGLAALSTVAYGVFRTKIEPELIATQGHPSARATAVASTHGYTAAFVVAAAMLLGAGVLTLVGLSIKHDELATDDPEVPDR